MQHPIKILLPFYIAGILLLHALPFGGLDVDDASLGSLRLTHLLHVIMFMPWGFAGLLYVYRRPERRLSRGVLWVGLGLVCAGAAEGIQHALPYRAFNVTDFICNAIGVAIGALVLVILQPRSDTEHSALRPEPIVQQR